MIAKIIHFGPSNQSDFIEAPWLTNLVKNSKFYDNHEKFFYTNDHVNNLEFIIAIHNTIRGPSFGGCRMKIYNTFDEAVDDSLKLSKAMTYKSAICDLPFGGGKSIIIGDPKKYKTHEILIKMGRFVNSVNGEYLIADDVGTTVKDMAVIRKISPYARGMADELGNPTPATAYGLFMSLKATAKFRFGTDTLDGILVAVQGLGSVGSRLCKYLFDAGAKLIVTDINQQVIDDAVSKYNATSVLPQDIYNVKADIFSPCALGDILNEKTVKELYAPIIVGAANNQLQSEEISELLFKSKIVYAPDYVANAGGVIDISHEGINYNPQTVLKDCERLYNIVTEILEQSSSENQNTTVIANKIAEKRLTMYE